MEKFTELEKQYALTIARMLNLEKAFIQSEDRQRRIQLMREYIQDLDHLIEIKGNGPGELNKEGTIMSHIKGLIDEVRRLIFTLVGDHSECDHTFKHKVEE